jgi:cytochrome c553
MLFAASGAGADPGSSPGGDREAGAEVYAGCAVCHGDDGTGRADGTFPRIAGQHASVVAKQIEDIRSGARSNPIMASHIEMLTDPEEVADVAAYVAALSPDPASATGERSAVGATERGAELYARDCRRCHGDRGEGSAERAVPVVAGQHSAYLLRQLRAIAGSRRRNAHPHMVEAVFDYPDADLRALSEYLAALAWPPTTTEP